jgi:hypothetical protein
MSRQLTTGVPVGLPDMGPVVNTSGTAVVAITPGYSDADGAWIQLVASTSADVHWVRLRATNFNDAADAIDQFVAFGVGGAGAEVSVVTFPLAASDQGCTYDLPLFIAAGSRVAFRASSSSATLPLAPTVQVAFYRRRAGDLRRSPSSIAALGVTATNKGTAVGTSDTWTELTASTTQPYQGLMFAASVNDASVLTSFDTLALGVGASGAEVEVWSHGVAMTAAEAVIGAFTPMLCHVPAGSRVSAKSSSATNSGIRALALAIPYT